MKIWDTGTYETHKCDAAQGRGRRSTASGSAAATGCSRSAASQGQGTERLDDPPDGPARSDARARADARPDRADAGRRRRGCRPTRRATPSRSSGTACARSRTASRAGSALESRNLNEITAAYPEVRGPLRPRDARGGARRRDRGVRRRRASRASSACRAGCTSPRPTPSSGYRSRRRSSTRSSTCSTSTARSLMRAALRASGVRGSRRSVWAGRRGGCRPHTGARAPAARGDPQQGLEGVVAKRLDSRYEPGRRTGAWIKIKHTAPPGAGDRRLAARRGAADRADRRAADGLLRK